MTTNKRSFFCACIRMHICCNSCEALLAYVCDYSLLYNQIRKQPFSSLSLRINVSTSLKVKERKRKANQVCVYVK